MGIISDEAKEKMLEKIKEFKISADEITHRNQMRSDFVAKFTPEKIKVLTPSQYFLGEGKKDCMSYQLEWGTIKLGSIKGGSDAKFGAKEQFNDIKKLLIDLTSLSDQNTVFYKFDGKLTDISERLILQSSKIKGMITGKTVLGKLLSIYYPNTFMPFFSDQYYLLNNITKDYANDSMGLKSYLQNNFLFLKIKEDILEEPAFEIQKEQFTNDF